jgi:hypothetical protein
VPIVPIGTNIPAAEIIQARSLGAEMGGNEVVVVSG